MTNEVEAVFLPNKTLDRPLRRAMRKNRVGWLNRVKVWRALRDPEKREEIEYALTERAREMNAIPLEAVGDDGVFVGSWLDMFDWIIANWPAIMEMIMTIISLFQAKEDKS